MGKKTEARWQAWKAYTNGDVWAVGPVGTSQVHIMVYPQPGVLTEMRAAWIVRELNAADAATVPSQPEIRSDRGKANRR